MPGYKRLVFKSKKLPSNDPFRKSSVFMHLKAEINWHEKFEKLIKNFNEKKVTSSQKQLLL